MTRYLAGLFLLVAQLQAASTWYVAPTTASPAGNDSAPGDGSITHPYATLRKVYTVMSGGDTVYLRAGDYVGDSSNNYWIMGWRPGSGDGSSDGPYPPSGPSANSPTVIAGYPADVQAGHLPRIQPKWPGFYCMLWFREMGKNITLKDFIVDGALFVDQYDCHADSTLKGQVDCFKWNGMTNCVWTNVHVWNLPRGMCWSLYEGGSTDGPYHPGEGNQIISCVGSNWAQQCTNFIDPNGFWDEAPHVLYVIGQRNLHVNGLYSLKGSPYVMTDSGHSASAWQWWLFRNAGYRPDQPCIRDGQGHKITEAGQAGGLASELGMGETMSNIVENCYTEGGRHGAAISGAYRSVFRNNVFVNVMGYGLSYHGPSIMNVFQNNTFIHCGYDPMHYWGKLQNGTFVNTYYSDSNTGDHYGGVGLLVSGPSGPTDEDLTMGPNIGKTVFNNNLFWDCGYGRQSLDNAVELHYSSDFGSNDKVYMANNVMAGPGPLPGKSGGDGFRNNAGSLYVDNGGNKSGLTNNASLNPYLISMNFPPGDLNGVLNARLGNTSSSAYNAGVSQTASWTSPAGWLVPGFAVDYLGNARPAANIWDVGAFEEGAGAPTTYTISVYVSPQFAVTITNSPSDNNSVGSGTPPFTLTFDLNTPVDLTAPASISGKNFQQWTVDGVVQVNNPVHLTMANNRTVYAYYTNAGSPTYTLTVNTSPVGRTMHIATTTDANGDGEGVPIYTRVYAPSTSVTLTAPDVNSAAETFSEWRLDGVHVNGNPITFSMTGNRTATSYYVPGPGGDKKDKVNHGKVGGRWNRN